MPRPLTPRARGACCQIFGDHISVENLGPEYDCNNRHVIAPVSNSTVLDDHILAADEFTCFHDPAIDLDGTSYDSELKVSETQFEISDVGEMSNDIEQ